jgi:hypothetical protein
MQALSSYLVKFAALADNSLAFVDPLALVQDLRNLCFNELSDTELGSFFEQMCGFIVFSVTHVRTCNTQ